MNTYFDNVFDILIKDETTIEMNCEEITKMMILACEDICPVGQTPAFIEQTPAVTGTATWKMVKIRREDDPKGNKIYIHWITKGFYFYTTEIQLDY